MKTTIHDDPKGSDDFVAIFRAHLESMEWAETYRIKHGEPTLEQITQARNRAYARIKSGLQ